MHRVHTKLDHFFLSFWQNVLDAGKSGIILIKLSTLCVGAVQSTSTIIISYKIELPNKYVHDVSTHIGRIEHVDRILQIDDAQLKFDSTNCNQSSTESSTESSQILLILRIVLFADFQDILTITATTAMMKYQLKYDSDDDLQELFEIFTKQLQFKDILQTLDSEDVIPLLLIIIMIPKKIKLFTLIDRNISYQPK